MWVAALGGIALWWFTRPRRRLNNPLQNQRRLHVTLGWLLLVGMLLFSATGLTSSQWAGGNVDKMRAAFGWLTPQLNAQLHGPRQLQDEHADHHGGRVMPEGPRGYSSVRCRITDRATNRTECAPAGNPPAEGCAARLDGDGDRSPLAYRVDAIAVDPATRQVTDRTRFADFPLMAKLTRWGVDFHMGILLGWPNQLLLIGFGTGLCLMIVIGYRLWWIRRPARPSASPAQTLVHSWLLLSMRGRVSVVLLAIALGVAMPVLGKSAAVHADRLAALGSRVTYGVHAVSRLRIKAC